MNDNGVEILKVNDKFDQCLNVKVLEDYHQKSELLKNQINNKKLIKKSLILLNEHNQNITISLLQKKKDVEDLKTHLNRNLHVMSTRSDKDKIILRKKRDEYLLRRFNFQSSKKSPLMLELENLMVLNTNLSKECVKVNHLLETTKNQYNEMVEYLQKNFQKTLCEFCDMSLKLKSPKRTSGE